MGGGNNNNNNNNFIGREFEDANEFNANGLSEPPGGCADPNIPDVQARRANSLTDQECVTNSCTGGCCRIYNWLICDESNSYDHLACVCNPNTSPPPPTPFPTMAPTLPPTTPAPTMPPPTTSMPTPLPTLPPVATAVTPEVEPLFNFTDNSTVAVDREDQGGAGSIDVGIPLPAPTTASPTTSSPTTSQPTPSPPTTSQPTPSPPTTSQPTPTPGPLLPWQQCSTGSIYHGNGATDCLYAEDCIVKDECCIRNFCLCGNPGGMDSECVPSRFI
eukprot:Sro234_g094350.2  (274) ;mRNA; f:18934-19755